VLVPAQLEHSDAEKKSRVRFNSVIIYDTLGVKFASHPHVYRFVGDGKSSSYIDWSKTIYSASDG
jgi:hypothetical protein